MDWHRFDREGGDEEGEMLHLGGYGGDRRSMRSHTEDV